LTLVNPKMFTSEERASLRDRLIECAARESRISGVAITGSAALNREDEWSDIDLAFGVHDRAQLPGLLSEWTGKLYEEGAIHHVDFVRASWIYRVFLLRNTLQVDLAFVATEEFRATAPTFKLICGHANEPRHITPSTDELIGLGWLYALHARSCIGRRHWWQAEYMISAVRDHTLALACLRLNLPARDGRGMDQLPKEVTDPFKDSLVRRLDSQELARAFQVVMHGLREEVRRSNCELAQRLDSTLGGLLPVT
jgi:predicted nucleotidyltransferase